MQKGTKLDTQLSYGKKLMAINSKTGDTLARTTMAAQRKPHTQC